MQKKIGGRSDRLYARLKWKRARGHLPKMDIQSIDHEKQRYDTIGDFFLDHGILNFRISRMKNPDYEMPVLLHELIEWYLVQKKGISIDDIDKFDMAFTGDGEPGDDPSAPYYEEHQFATKIEKGFIEQLGIDWDGYNLDITNENTC